MLSLIIGKLFKSKWLIPFTYLLSLVFLQNSWEHTPVSSFSGFFSFPILVLMSSIYIFIIYVELGNKKYLYLSLVSFIYVLLTYEVYIAYIIFYISLAFIYRGGLKEALLLAKHHIIASVSYMLVFIVVYINKSSVYGGADISTELNILDSLEVIWQLSISALPTYFLFNDKYQYLFYIYSESINKDIGLNMILQSISVEFYFKAFIVFVVIFYLLNKIKVKNNIKWKYFLILIIYFFIPAVPLSITPQYIESVQNEGMLGVPITYFSYLTLVAIIVSLVIVVKKWALKFNESFKIIINIILSIIIAVISMGVDFNNYYINKEQSKLASKWEVVNEFVNTDYYNNIPDGAFVISPTLYETKGSLGIHDGYWTDYVQVKSNSSKIVHIVRSIDQIPAEVNDYFILKFIQNEDILYKQALIIGLVNKNVSDIHTNQVTIFDMSSDLEMTIYGVASSVIELTGGKVIEADGQFNVKADPSNYTIKDDLKIFNLSGNEIDLNSININYSPDIYYE